MMPEALGGTEDALIEDSPVAQASSISSLHGEVHISLEAAMIQQLRLWCCGSLFG
jgi:hypothetical protein